MMTRIKNPKKKKKRKSKGFKDNAKWKYESFGSKGRVKITKRCD